MMLAGEHPVLASLREQLHDLSVQGREYTGVGFFTSLVVRGTPARCGRVVIDDVVGSIPELARPVGFILFVEEGQLHVLEGFAHAEEWRDPLGDFTLSYSDPQRTKLRVSLDALNQSGAV